MTTDKQHLADAGAVVGWGGWILSHLEPINTVLQFILLVLSIIATAVAIRYHLRKTPK